LLLQHLVADLAAALLLRARRARHDGGQQHDHQHAKQRRNEHRADVKGWWGKRRGTAARPNRYGAVSSGGGSATSASPGCPSSAASRLVSMTSSRLCTAGSLRARNGCGPKPSQNISTTSGTSSPI